MIVRVLPLCLAVLFTACGGQAQGGPSAPSPSIPNTGTPSPSAPSAACSPGEAIAVQGGSHLLEDQAPPVPYESTPPTSGWHSSVVPDLRAYSDDEALTEPQQVAILEAGGLVITHGPLSPDQQRRLDEAVETHAEHAAATPYAPLAADQVVFASWGALQRCTGVDPEVLDVFVAEHLGQAEDHQH